MIFSEQLLRALDVDPSPPSGSKGFGTPATTSKKRAKAKGDFRGLLLSNQTHRSSSDGEARLFKKAPAVGAFLSFMGYCVMENRNGMMVASEFSQEIGKAERDASVRMARPLRGAHQKPLCADKGFDIREFLAGLRIKETTLHVAQLPIRRGGSAIDSCTALY